MGIQVMLGRVISKSISKAFSLMGMSNFSSKQLKAALLLSGCGRLDGSEIYESVSCLISLSRNNIEFEAFSLNKMQYDVVNPITGHKMKQQRNLMEESARLTRGKVKDIIELKADDYDTLVVPGGSGVGKNLCTYVVKGENYIVDPMVEAVLKDFYNKKKPIALCCIAPMIAAKVFGTKSGGPGIEMTMGKKGLPAWPYSNTIDISTRLGNILIPADTTEFHVDKVNQIYTTPCYLKGDATPSQVFEGIEKMITQLANDLKSKAAQNL
eukprot:TRINITY_DN661_c0_g1_i1.p1 TRINITY_DN661_c0_g1~~TRINITY_DN661_c0_g1_i1.p1  ORF type:complete len:300 (+),score=52.38 TRINITY_DN661_c0_g1_i1:98-901(+)